MQNRKVDAPLKELFSQHNTHVQWDKNFNLWTGRIFYHDTIEIEPYTLQAGTSGHLYTIGSFSYIQSTLPVDTKIGRYSSITDNVTVRAQGIRPKTLVLPQSFINQKTILFL